MRRGKYNAGGADGEMMYDDTDFTLFAVAILAVFWVPVALFKTIRYIRRLRHTKTPMEKAKDDWCVCSLCQKKADKIRAKSSGIHAWSVFDVIFAVVTVLLFFSVWSAYKSNLKSEKPFDPFEILNIPTTASERDVKRAFRRLSVTMHPDKNPNNPEAAEKFITLSKAYAALTDEDSKENYAKYGNPDGYMGTSWGLGLPQWVGERRESVLLAYGLIIVIIFPSIVGFWWHKSKQQLTSEIMTSTFMLFCETLNKTTRFRDLLAAFCGSDEFVQFYTSDNDEAIKQINESMKRIGGLPKSKTVFEPPFSQIHNLMVMTAYLARLPIPSSLNYLLEGILMRAEPLLTSLTDTVGVFQRPDCKAAWNRMFMHGHTTYLSRCLHLTQCIYQAVDEKASPLLQIPHFTEREVKYCTSSRTGQRSIYDLMRMDMTGLHKLLRDFSDDQILDVKAFCDRFPSATLEVEKACVKGEEDTTVHEGDTVTVRATLRVLRRSGSAFSPHVPNLPYRKEEVWWMWLSDQRLLCPIEVRRLLPKMARGHDETRRRGFDEEDSEDEDGLTVNSDEKDPQTEAERERRKRREEEVVRLAADPRVTVFEVAFKFAAPRAGIYLLEVKAACDCYAGAGKTEVIRMDVKKAAEVAEVEEEDFSDEEDEEESEEESEDEEEEEGEGEEGMENGDANGATGEEEEEETDGEYEYIEVTASESEAGDFEEEEDDDYGVCTGSCGDPAMA